MKQGNETGSLGQEGEWHLKLNGQGRPHLAGVIGVKGGPLSSGHSWQPVLPPLQCRQGGRKLSSGGPGLGNGGGTGGRRGHCCAAPDDEWLPCGEGGGPFRWGRASQTGPCMS